MTAARVRTVRGRPGEPRPERRMDEDWRGSRASGGTGHLGQALPLAGVPPFEREVAVMRAWFTGQTHGRAVG